MLTKANQSAVTYLENMSFRANFCMQVCSNFEFQVEPDKEVHRPGTQNIVQNYGWHPVSKAHLRHRVWQCKHHLTNLYGNFMQSDTNDELLKPYRSRIQKRTREKCATRSNELTGKVSVFSRMSHKSNANSTVAVTFSPPELH